MKKAGFILAFVLVVIFFNACQQPGGNVTGSEFMPDMAHSIAYEANTYSYYYNNTWGSKEEYHKYAQPRLPVSGTIARGYAGEVATDGSSSPNAIPIRANGNVPYNYGNTEEERLRAMTEIIENPYPISDEGLEEGKALYIIYCAICHGDNGDGAGYLVREADPAKGVTAGVYPVQPAILINDEFTAASNGRYYHAIMHGRNLMGAYADKLSYEERWQVIHYVRSLQAKNLKLSYNEMENTLNEIDVPASKLLVADHVEEGMNEMEPGDGGHNTDVQATEHH
jgi:mono/diheme cytochrome c family protein